MIRPLTFAVSLAVFCTISQAQVVQIADMNVARSGHTASQMQTGEVIVTGGLGADNYLSAAEYWDQENDEWIEVDQMEHARMNHAATVVDGNLLIVTGGWDGDFMSLNSCEIFNFDLGVWEGGPDMNDHRSLHRATKLNNTEILISGGTDNSEDLRSCELYNSTFATFTDVDSMNTGRSSHTSTLLSDGQVLVTGGYNAAEGFQLSSCEIYDPATDEWTTVSSMNEPRDNHAAMMLNVDQVIVTGGRWFNAAENRFEGRNDYEIYNVDTDTWDGPYELGAPVSYHDMAIMWSFEPNIFIPGGTNHSGSGVETSYSQLMYFESAGAPFVSPGDLPITEKFRYAMALLDDSNALVCGGHNDNTAYTFGIETSVNSVDNQQVTAFPNPVKHILNCPNSHGKYSFIDLYGRVVAEGDVSNGQIDVSLMPSGLFTLLTDDGHARIVVE